MAEKEISAIIEALKNGNEVLIKPIKDGYKILKLSMEVISKK